MAADDPLTPAELAFRALLEPVKDERTGHERLQAEYVEDCRLARERWERDNVVWYYGANDKGGSTWGSKRPKPELYALLVSRGQLRWMLRSKFLAELEAAKGKR